MLLQLWYGQFLISLERRSEADSQARNKKLTIGRDSFGPQTFSGQGIGTALRTCSMTQAL